jgi:AcrR family transcriptional regulator
MSRTIGSNGPKTLEAIRRAGLRLIFEHGYEAMSLRQLASEVGIQVGSLYNHISTKQDLLMMLVEAHMRELLGDLEAALDGITAPVERLRAFVGFHVTYHMTKKREVYVANFELRALEPKNYDALIKLRQAYERRLTEILDDGNDAKLFDISDTRVATFAILATLTGVCTWYKPSGRLSKQAIVALHEKLVINGAMRSNIKRPAPARRRERASLKRLHVMRDGPVRGARMRLRTLDP